MSDDKPQKPLKPLTVRVGSNLERRIKLAQEEMKTWPQWMRDAATVEDCER